MVGCARVPGSAREEKEINRPRKFCCSGDMPGVTPVMMRPYLGMWESLLTKQSVVALSRAQYVVSPEISTA